LNCQDGAESVVELRAGGSGRSQADPASELVDLALSEPPQRDLRIKM
jgi:hypothetical protein